MANVSEKVILVDTSDNPIGLMDKQEAHQKALLHRAFSIFIYKQTGNDYYLLLQQRQLNKYHGGGLWTNSCCSHPRAGEPTLDAAHRRLVEEMGLDIKLTAAGSFIYKAVMDKNLTEHEFDYVFNGMYFDEDILVNPDEVAAYRFVTIPELKKDLSINPHLYTPWLAQALEVSLRVL